TPRARRAAPPPCAARPGDAAAARARRGGCVGAAPLVRARVVHVAARLADRLGGGARARRLRHLESPAAPRVRRRDDECRRRDLADADRTAARVRRRSGRADVSRVRGVRRRAQLSLSRKDGFPMTRSRARILLVALAAALAAVPLGAAGQLGEYSGDFYGPA